MKKFVSLCVVALVLAAGVVGCGEKKPTGSTAPAGGTGGTGGGAPTSTGGTGK